MGNADRRRATTNGIPLKSESQMKNSKVRIWLTPEVTEDLPEVRFQALELTSARQANIY